MPVGLGNLKNPIVLSVLFHLFVVTATSIGWPFLSKPKPTNEPIYILLRFVLR